MVHNYAIITILNPVTFGNNIIIIKMPDFTGENIYNVESHWN